MPQQDCPLLGIRRVHLWVRELHRSVAFYREMFGLVDQPVEPRSSKVRQCVAPNDGLGTVFGLVFTEGLSSGVDQVGLDHISLEVSCREDLLSVYRRALERNARVTPPRIYAGHWQVFVFDPDGYKIELYCHREAGNGSREATEEIQCDYVQCET